MTEKKLSTQVIHAGGIETAKRISASVSVPKVLPIYMTSAFSFDDVPPLDDVYEGRASAYVYSRMANPNSDAAAEILAAAEGADGAMVYSSGMAAITGAVLSRVRAGDHIVASRVLYGGVYDFFAHELPRFGVKTSFVDFQNPDAIRMAVRENTVILYAETISNPTMEVLDIPMAAEIAHEKDALLLVDNTFATPALVCPLEYGADISLYSATKFLSGHGDLTGGATAARGDLLAGLRRQCTLYGAVMGPFDAWLLSRSLRTLDLRMDMHSKNAERVARFLESHPKVERVYYPGLPASRDKETADRLFRPGRYGGMLSADIAGGEAGAETLIHACRTIKLVPTLGGVSTTISYPAKTSHRAYTPEERAAAGIAPGQLRFSIGLEDGDDLLEELAAALDEV